MKDKSIEDLKYSNSRMQERINELVLELKVKDSEIDLLKYKINLLNNLLIITRTRA